MLPWRFVVGCLDQSSESVPSTDVSTHSRCLADYQPRQRADIGLPVYPRLSVLGGNKCQISPLVTLDFSIFEQIWLA